MLADPIPMTNYRCARCGVFVGRKEHPGEDCDRNLRRQGRVLEWGDLRAVRG